jgi:siroheme synthase
MTMEVITDDLFERVFKLVRPKAALTTAGKRIDAPSAEQSGINELLIEKAREC